MLKKDDFIAILSEDFPPYHGGIAQWAAGVADACQKMGYITRVLTRFRDDYPSTKNGLLGYSVDYIHGTNWRQHRTFYWRRAFRQLLKTHGMPAVCFATTWNVARGVFRLCRKRPIALVTVVHALEVTRNMSWLKKRWLTWTLQQSQCVVAVSEFTKTRLCQSIRLREDKVLVLPNGVNYDHFRPGLDTESLKKQWRIEDEKVILTLARVVKRKGHDRVLRALPDVLKVVPNLRYIIAGSWEASWYEELKQLACQLGLEQHVSFTGYVPPDETALYYNLCDVYIMPSRELTERGDTEGFGITFLEANACEKPVIGGNSGGVADAIEHGKTGYLVDPDDVGEISQLLIRLLTDAELAGQLGQQGRERICERYNWHALTQELLSHIHHSSSEMGVL